MLNPVGSSKLEAAYNGPYLIEEKISPVTYRISTPGRGKTTRIVHANFLKKWSTPSAEVLTTSLIQDECQENEGIILTIELTAPTDIKLSDNLNSQEKYQTLKLMAEFTDVCSLIPGLTSKAYHEVKTGNSAPIRAVPYTIPVHYFEKVRGEIKKMLEIGIIERSKSQWASPLITVLNKMLGRAQDPRANGAWLSKLTE